MKKKRILASVLALALAVTFTGAVYAEDTVQNVEYKNGKLEVNNADMSGFEDMLPGVTRSGIITLKNSDSSATVRFYMDTNVASTLEGAETKDNKVETGYTVSMYVTQSGTTSETVLFGSGADADSIEGNFVGNEQIADETRGLEEMNDMLDGAAEGDVSTYAEGDTRNDLLVATLAPGATAEVHLSITADATATSADFMAGAGKIEFKFAAEELNQITRTETRTVKGETTIVTQTRYWLNGVQTGDPVAIAPLVAVLVLAVLVFLIAAKKKKKKEE